eukprot:GHUV01027128.1.p5 GENE.GHUV01027128.1~~GHUV01027128.1.p5  ORF type:complete len:103 (+),score=30.85 GHUV01027128.1:1511-1819(+)
MLDDLRLSHKHIHQIATGHQIKQEVQMVGVLQTHDRSKLVSISTWWPFKAMPGHSHKLLQQTTYTAGHSIIQNQQLLQDMVSDMHGSIGAMCLYSANGLGMC